MDDLGEALGRALHVTVLRRTAVADYPTEKDDMGCFFVCLQSKAILHNLINIFYRTDTAVSEAARRKRPFPPIDETRHGMATINTQI